MEDDQNEDRDQGGEDCSSDELRVLLGLVGEDVSDPPSLAQLKKEARAYGKRRADQVGSRDNLIYRIGYAVDAAGGLAISADAFAGILSSNSLIMEALTVLGEEKAGSSLLEVIMAVLEIPAIRKWAEREGKYLQWVRLAKLAAEETEKFEASAANADPKASWRKKHPTIDQRYMLGEISRIHGIEIPAKLNRQEAGQLIKSAGGNPRFLKAPKRPGPPLDLRSYFRG